MARLRRELPHVVAALDEAAAKRERSRVIRDVNKVESEIEYGLYGDERNSGMVSYNEVMDAIEGKSPRKARR
jgi:hypothetical protein